MSEDNAAQILTKAGLLILSGPTMEAPFDPFIVAGTVSEVETKLRLKSGATLCINNICYDITQETNNTVAIDPII